MGVEELLLDSKDPHATWMGCCIYSTHYAEQSFKKNCDETIQPFNQKRKRVLWIQLEYMGIDGISKRSGLGVERSGHIWHSRGETA
jgi:hypothetical protein